MWENDAEMEGKHIFVHRTSMRFFKLVIGLPDANLHAKLEKPLPPLRELNDLLKMRGQ
jgi:hypothetical protein